MLKFHCQWCSSSINHTSWSIFVNLMKTKIILILLLIFFSNFILCRRTLFSLLLSLSLFLSFSPYSCYLFSILLFLLASSLPKNHQLRFFFGKRQFSSSCYCQSLATHSVVGLLVLPLDLAVNHNSCL